jgi:hypothetical protein
MGTSQLFLTLIEHRGTIWNVYLSTARDTAPTARMQLAFEPAGENPAGVRHVRPVAGNLWSALQAGESLQRSELAAELGKALDEHSESPVEETEPGTHPLTDPPGLDDDPQA